MDSLPEFLPRLSVSVTLLLSLWDKEDVYGANSVTDALLNATTVGDFEKQPTHLGPKSDFFFFFEKLDFNRLSTLDQKKP